MIAKKSKECVCIRTKRRTAENTKDTSETVQNSKIDLQKYTVVCTNRTMQRCCEAVSLCFSNATDDNMYEFI